MASYEIDKIDVEYLRVGDVSLKATIFKPRGKGPFPAMVECHGGAWAIGTRANNTPINEPWSAHGVVLMALDFRIPPVAGYPASIQDINYGVRWLKAHAAEYATKPEWVGLTGTSSGGHLAIWVAMKATDPSYASITGPAGIDAKVPYVISLWPVINPVGRYNYIYGRQLSGAPYPKGMDDMIGHQNAYWGTQARMAEGAPALALERGERMEMPEILYVQNLEDPLHPRPHLDHFIAEYRKAGGQVATEFFEGKNYDIVRSDPSSAEAKRIVAKMAEFAHAHCK